MRGRIDPSVFPYKRKQNDKSIKDIQGHLKAFKDIQRHSKAIKGTQGRSKAFKDNQRHSRADQMANDRSDDARVA